jgi:hypothetical protein
MSTCPICTPPPTAERAYYELALVHAEGHIEDFIDELRLVQLLAPYVARGGHELAAADQQLIDEAITIAARVGVQAHALGYHHHDSDDSDDAEDADARLDHLHEVMDVFRELQQRHLGVELPGPDHTHAGVPPSREVVTEQNRLRDRLWQQALDQVHQG